MEQQQRLKKVTEKLTNECWDLCVSNPGVSKLDSKTETCLVNCVDRFLDTSQYILSEFSKRNQSAQSASSSSSFATDSDLILEDKFSSDSSFKTESSSSSSSTSSSDQSKSGSSWKFW